MLKKIALLSFILLFNSFSKSNTKFVIVTASYNNSDVYQENLDSIFSQKYSNYRLIYIDDHSTDSTGDLVDAYVKENNISNKVTLIKNSFRQGALANIYRAIISCEDDEVVVIVDGDDCFYDAHVLSKLDQVYSSSDTWLTYGSCLGKTGDNYRWKPIADSVIKSNTFRGNAAPGHLRTFYSWLGKSIKIEDLFYDGKFFEMAYDAALMFPMLEMAGEHINHISDFLYIYNDINSINDHKVNHDYQHQLSRYVIESKKRYQPLQNKKYFEYNSGYKYALVSKLDLPKNVLDQFELIIDLNNADPNMVLKQLRDSDCVGAVYVSKFLSDLGDLNDMKYCLDLTKAFGFMITDQYKDAALVLDDVLAVGGRYLGGESVANLCLIDNLNSLDELINFKTGKVYLTKF